MVVGVEEGGGSARKVWEMGIRGDVEGGDEGGEAYCVVSEDDSCVTVGGGYGVCGVGSYSIVDRYKRRLPSSLL